MKLIISGCPLPEPLTIELTQGEVSVMDGPALNRDHAMEIVQAWSSAPPKAEDDKGPSDLVRQWLIVGSDGDDEQIITALHMESELTMDRWLGKRGYYLADWPFDFEWELVEDPPTRLPIEQRIPGWGTLNTQARRALEAHDSVLQPDAWFKGVHDGRVLEYLAAVNSGADGDSSDAVMVSILLDFSSRVALEVSTRQLHDNIWTDGYEA